jgi:NitT/TauT family transport system ATP-binding protein
MVALSHEGKDRVHAITVKDVSKSFGSLKVLDRVDCDLCDGEFVSILGPSGCGKSTLLRLIAGLNGADDGEISVLGDKIVRPNEKIGFVFQTSNLLPWLTVRQNLLLGIELDRRASAPETGALNAVIASLGLSGFEESYPHELSGGMKQRVAIGQALIRSPQVLLMDEPFGALDALTRDKLNVELLRIWQAEQKTVLLVTHSIAEAVLLSDRVLVMSNRPGRITNEIQIKLGRPRNPTEVRRMPEFGAYVTELGALMGVG